MIDKQELIAVFFSRSYEQPLNEKILDDIYFAIPKNNILNYCHALLEVSISEFLYYIIGLPIEKITSFDLTQCSSFESCEKLMIDGFLKENNRGLDFVEIGQLFPQYVKTQTVGAFRKYGENQVKTASQLGLTFEYYGKWYLNCIGYVYNELDEKEKKALLARNLLRSPLYGRLVSDMCFDDVCLNDYFKDLSTSTIDRRLPNIKNILQIILDVCKEEGVELKCYSHTRPCHIGTEHILDKKNVKLVCTKNVDKCFLTRGFTLPMCAIDIVENIVDEPVRKGEPRNISMMLFGREFICRLLDVNFSSSENRCLQIYWPGDMSMLLQQTFSELYEYIVDASNRTVKRGRGHIPELMRREVKIYGVEGEGRFIIECQKKT